MLQESWQTGSTTPISKSVKRLPRQVDVHKTVDPTYGYIRRWDFHTPFWRGST